MEVPRTLCTDNESPKYSCCGGEDSRNTWEDIDNFGHNWADNKDWVVPSTDGVGLSEPLEGGEK